MAKATFFDGETQKITSVKETINGKDVETLYGYFPNSYKIETETILVDGKETNFIHYREDRLKDISRKGNEETKYLYYPNGKLLSADTTADGKRIHFEHYDKDSKDDTRMYLVKQKVAARQVEKGEQKGKVQKKLNPISKAWKLHKALREVDSEE